LRAIETLVKAMEDLSPRRSEGSGNNQAEFDEAGKIRYSL